jgi:hypothetical protein
MTTTTTTYRTDRNNNPAAFTVDIARQAGLVEGEDYVSGERFPQPSNLITARLLKDPIATTIRVIDKIGYYTKQGSPRWTYIAIPTEIWQALPMPERIKAIRFHYEREGGTQMSPLFSAALQAATVA